VAEAAEIHRAGQKIRPHTWPNAADFERMVFSAKLHCLRTAPEVFDAAASWMELADYIPAALTGTQKRARKIHVRGFARGPQGDVQRELAAIPTANSSRYFRPNWARAARLCAKARDISAIAGGLTGDGPPAPASRGHSGGGGRVRRASGGHRRGAAPGTLVKIIGTSTCDIAVWPLTEKLADIPGLCASVRGSVLPDCYGWRRGNRRLGDIFNWFVNYIQPGGARARFARGPDQGGRAPAGGNPVLALDWNNGNATVLVDQRLTGLLRARPFTPRRRNVSRAHRGHRLRRFDHHQPFARIRRAHCPGGNCGGIAEKNPLVMQIYADGHGPADESVALGPDGRAGRAVARRGCRSASRFRPRPIGAMTV